MRYMVVLSMALVAGCVAPMTVQQHAARASDSSLCFNAQRNPSYEVQRISEAEIARRSVTCTQEMVANFAAERNARIQQQQANDANFNAAARAVIQSRQPAPAPAIQPEIRCQTYTSGGQTYTTCR